MKARHNAHAPAITGSSASSAPKATRNPARPQNRSHSLELPVIPITPLGKPRMTQRDKWQQRPAVMRYRAFCDDLREHTNGHAFGDALALTFTLPMPVSWSKKKRLALAGQPHQQKPDTDNLIKAVLDALYKDDSTVHTIHARKTWGATGSITITSLELEDPA